MTTGKRKRDTSDLPTAKLQTAGLSTPQTCRIQNVLLEDSTSPRTAVSARFQGLNLMSTQQTDMPPISRAADGTLSQRATDDKLAFRVVAKTTQPDTYSNLADFMKTNDIEHYPKQHFVKLESEARPDDTISDKEPLNMVYRFHGGNSHPSTPSSSSEIGIPATSPTKRQKFAQRTSVNMVTPPPTRSRDSRVSTLSPEISLLLPFPIARSRSPSAKKLTTPTRCEAVTESGNGMSMSVSDSSSEDDVAALWWQDEEITGHDPDDPEDDNRGINGIGYQKSRAEQSRISDRKKKQIAEWKTREAKEARALRSGKRAMQGVITGRVTKSSSRSGSPVDRRGSPSSGFRRSAESMLDTAPFESPSKGVRFKEQPDLEGIEIDFRVRR